MTSGPRRRHAKPAIVLLLALVVAPPLAALAPAPVGEPPASLVGQWSLPAPTHVEAIHAALLPTGKVLLFANNNGVRLLDPTTGVLQNAALPFGNNIFCSGHTLLPDGRVLVVGGTLPGGYIFRGENTTFLFDPWTETWTRGPDMNVGRWYPTPVSLGDGRVMVFSGLNETGETTPIVEVRDPVTGRWSVVHGADRYHSLFPRLLLLPSGELFKAGHEGQTMFFQPDTGQWRPGPSMGAARWQGSAVLLPGLDKVLVAGGGGGAYGTAMETASVLDLGAAPPAWSGTGSMAFPRRDLNLVILADGQVLAVGGAMGPTSVHLPEDPAELQGDLDSWLFRWPSSLNAELYDPATGAWSLMAPAQRGRTYHSTAMLLPDARVLVMGSDIETAPNAGQDTRTYEVFSPPSLFKGPRPAIASAPAAVAHGASFDVTSPDAGSVATVALVRLGSVTHAFNFDQRHLPLDFTVEGTTIHATAPPTPHHAPPGWYMLFLLDGHGVPSVARMVHLA